MSGALVVRNLCKTYPEFKLNNVSFEIKPGRIMGFIGRNGAGKTTTLKIIYGLARQDSGEVYFDGKKIVEVDSSFKSQVGLLFGGVDFYPGQKVKNLTEVTKRFYPSWDDCLYYRWLKFFGISENKKIKELSNGMKVKYGLAVALSHGAKLLLLDEPTSGLDPVSRDEVLDCLRDIADRENAAVLFSTHVISDLEKCADDITYIKEGKILYTGEVSGFENGYIHVEGDASSLSGEQRRSIGHLRIRSSRFEGVTSKETASDIVGEKRQATMEEIMLSIERGE